MLEMVEVRSRLSPVSVEEYHRRVEFNLHGRRTELVRGLVIEKMSKSPLHTTIASRVLAQVNAQLKAGWYCRKEEPLTFRDSEPEPDLAVVAGGPEDHLRQHPTSAALVVEIAVPSAALDRENASLYAENGVTEYWIVLPRERIVEVRRGLGFDRYREMQVFGAEEVVECRSVPGLSLSLDLVFAGLT